VIWKPGLRSNNAWRSDWPDLWGAGAVFYRQLVSQYPVSAGDDDREHFGCFVLGLFMAVIRERFEVSETTRLAIASGFVGAYTTFSTLMYDCVAFYHRSEWGRRG